jgi:hypothetical protein
MASNSTFLLLSGLESISPGHAVWVKVWSLAQTNGSVSESLSITLIIKGSGMEGATVIPDSYVHIRSASISPPCSGKLTNVVLVLPAESHLQVMVFHKQLQEPLEQFLAFSLGQAINMRDMLANWEDGLPPSDGVGANHRMSCLELFAYIFRGTTRLRVDLETSTLSSFVEERLCTGSSQGLEELLDGFGDSIVNVVTGGPEGVWSSRESKLRMTCPRELTSTSFRQLHQSQARIIGRHWLEGNIAVPVVTRLLLWAQSAVVREFVELLSLH